MSLFFSESEEWKEQRRFALKKLKDFGIGKSSMETLIQKEIEDFAQSLKQDCGRVIDMSHRFNLSVINGLWTIMTGKRLPLDDPELLNLVSLMEWTLREFGKNKIFNGLPWLRFIAPKMSGWEEFKKKAYTILDFIDKTLNPHLSSYNVDGNKN